MIDLLIKTALRHRFTILLLSLVLGISGIWVGSNLPIDVFPNLDRPRVTLLAEAHGLAPEEVESLVTVPLESSLQGTPGVIQMRSDSGLGISILHLDFEWGTDPFRNRQLISERLNVAKERLPEDVQVLMAPMTSIMGEIQFAGLTYSDEVDSLKVREYADWVLRPALLGISGISQVVVMGGGAKEIRIQLDAEKLAKRQLRFSEVLDKLKDFTKNTTGGVINQENLEYIVRPMGRSTNLSQIENVFVGRHFNQAVKLKEVASVSFAAKEKRGEASIDGDPSVLLSIQKQPGQDTVKLSRKIDKLLDGFSSAAPKGVLIRKDLFKQAKFIQHAVANVKEALRDGTIIVAIVLFLFLMNLRTTAITLTAIPMSFAMTFLIFKWFGLEINTMTLGGLAIAVGELVDDAIVDVENVFRRLKENKQRENPRSAIKVVYDASKEIRSSLVYSTAIVVAVFIPLFALSGLSGRFFSPMGIAYIVSLSASLLVSLTLTPVMCYLLLPKARATESPNEAFLVRLIKSTSKPFVSFSLKSPWVVLGISSLLLALSIWKVTQMGASFLPEFNEGSATIGVAAYPGISLPESDKLGKKIEKGILSVKEAKSTVRRTGRAEMDEHAEGVHWHEIDVDFHEQGRDRKIVLNEIRKNIEAVGDVYVNVGQPISHRIDHMMSGIRAQIAIKVFGHDSVELRRLAVQTEQAISEIKGITDLSIEPVVKVPQIAIEFDHFLSSKFGIIPGHSSESLEQMLAGIRIGEFVESQRRFDIVARLDEKYRSKPDQIRNLPISFTPIGAPVRVKDVADVFESDGPNHIKREAMQRRLIVSANAIGRPLSEVAEEVRNKIESIQMPEGFFMRLDGQYQEIISSERKILLLSTL